MPSCLSRRGFVIPKAELAPGMLFRIRKELRVRADWDPVASYGPKPEAFNVFSEDDDDVCLPEHWARQAIGEPAGNSFVVEQRPNMRFSGSLKAELRQGEAVEACLKAMSEVGGGILASHTGSGKTTMALFVACKLQEKTLIIVNRAVLLEQWRERIQAFVPGASVGVVRGEACDIEGHDFVLAMLQTLARRASPMRGFGLLVVDECVHVAAPFFSRAMLRVNCPHKLGLSATPHRKDGLTRVLLWFLGPIFMTLERTEQQRVQVQTLDFDGPVFAGPPPTRQGKLNFEAVVRLLCEDDSRNRLIVTTLAGLPPNRKALVLSARREHCKQLVAAIGPDAALYLGGMKQDQLAAAAEARVVVATYTVAAEGLDIPALNTLVLCTPKRDVVQACGRIMRGQLAEVDPLILDVRDSWACLRGQWGARKAYYTRSGFTFSRRGSFDAQSCSF